VGRSSVICSAGLRGFAPVWSHGGGPEINQWLSRMSIEPRSLMACGSPMPRRWMWVEMVLVQAVQQEDRLNGP